MYRAERIRQLEERSSINRSAWGCACVCTGCTRDVVVIVTRLCLTSFWACFYTSICIKTIAV